VNTSPDNKREEPETLIFGATSPDQAASTASTTANSAGHAGAYATANTARSGQQPVGPEQSASKPQKPGIRFSTIIWGLIVAFAGALLLLGALGREFDVQLLSIVALGVSGIVLLVSAIARSIRS
jgi:ferric-dicitrate binding protein FerR (iron transport regulator)